MKYLKLFAFGILSIFIISSCDEDVPIDPNVDLTVTIINVSSDDIDRDENDFTGSITLTGVVKNIGTDDYTSSTEQQNIHLFEEPLGGTSTIVKTIDFTNIAAGDSILISYTRNWDLTIEFPPSFKVGIVYDPDILSDSNLSNDDDDLTNNSKTITGFNIHDLF